MKRAARGARSAIAIAIAALGAAGAGGCPSRDLLVQISETGVTTVISTCETGTAACSNPLHCKDNALCTVDPGSPSGCRLAKSCHIGEAGHPSWVGSAPKHMKLVLIDVKKMIARAETACIAIQSDCGPDFACAADALNHALKGAFPDGLTFDGLEDPDDALLTLAIYQDTADTAAPPCVLDNLVACAGLAPPLRGGPYDVTCVSCQGGLRLSIGTDTGPCPVLFQECFLERCASAIARGE